ncbi:Uncharacterized protein PPKH_2274 [Pseudomonas putida]|nr:Uncharacterized protein PPKH_2274 [Pseudomonas putida]
MHGASREGPCTLAVRRGIKTLIALSEEAEERWCPAMRECIGPVLKQH